MKRGGDAFWAWALGVLGVMNWLAWVTLMGRVIYHHRGACALAEAMLSPPGFLWVLLLHGGHKPPGSPPAAKPG
jgi:hypothetical protein